MAALLSTYNVLSHLQLSKSDRLSGNDLAFQSLDVERDVHHYVVRQCHWYIEGRNK